MDFAVPQGAWPLGKGHLKCFAEEETEAPRAQERCCWAACCRLPVYHPRSYSLGPVLCTKFPPGSQGSGPDLLDSEETGR